jgi:competence protein ComEC
MQAVPVGWLATSLVEDHPLLTQGVPHYRCEAGQRWTWDGVTFDIVHPSSARYELAQSRHNDS